MSVTRHDPPAPWSAAQFLLAGGVIEAGWTATGHLLLVSHDGYSVMDLATKTQALHDGDSAVSDAALSEDGLEFTVPATGEVVKVFGLYGGAGIELTDDGWGLTISDPDSAQPVIYLRAPDGALTRIAEPLGDVRGVSFSPDGHLLVIVDSATTQFHIRAVQSD